MGAKTIIIPPERWDRKEFDTIVRFDPDIGSVRNSDGQHPVESTLAVIGKSGFHQAYNLAAIGMTAGLKFGKDQFPVNNDIENASRTFLHLRLDPEFLSYFRCDTRSLRQVVSFTAILDQNVHSALLRASVLSVILSDGSARCKSNGL